MNFTRLLELFKLLNWGDVPTWLGSIGTVGTLVFTLHQLNLDRNERRENEIKFQARNISTWIIGENEDYITVRLSNSSNAPVYSVILTLVSIQGAGLPRDGKEVLNDYKYRKIISILPPRDFETKLPYSGRGMGILFGVEIAFMDSNGNSWVRKSDGKLIAIKQKPKEYYNLISPFSEESCEEISK